MTHWKKLTNPNYLGSYAFQPGEEKAVTISTVGLEPVRNPEGETENLIVVHFEQPEKPLILNKTNCKTIEKLAGTPDIESWPGVGILLCVQRVKAFGELVEAVRIRPVKPFICSDCGGIITGYRGRTHAEIREYTRKEYKRQLCAACATKAAESRQQPELGSGAGGSGILRRDPSADDLHQDPEQQQPEQPDPDPEAEGQSHRRRRASAQNGG